MPIKIPLQSGGEEIAADRIMKQLDNRLTGEPKPTRKQVGMVLHALADHTAIMHMVAFDRMSKWHKGKEEELWPTETSIGRWFHGVGDDLEGRFEPAKKYPKLTEIEEYILSELRGDNEYCMGYRGLITPVKTQKILAPAIKHLKELEFIDFYRGLMTEEGEVAGSGWCRSRKGSEYVEEYGL